MPLRNLFKNSFHYWILSGVLLAWFVYIPQSVQSQSESLFASLPWTGWAGLALYTIGQSFNARVHLIQRGLRRPGTTERRIPHGPGFNWVTCPNYMFEIVTWLGVLLLSRSWATAFFIAVSVYQMKEWADKKEARYRKEFGNKYRSKRYTVLPGLL